MFALQWQVVSGLDIIALDKTPGHVDTSDGMFPKIGKCDSYSGDQKLMWSDFLELKEVASRASSTTVGQIMHDAFTISISDTVEDAASKARARVAERCHAACAQPPTYDGCVPFGCSIGDVLDVRWDYDCDCVGL